MKFEERETSKAYENLKLDFMGHFIFIWLQLIQIIFLQCLYSCNHPQLLHPINSQISGRLKIDCK